MHSRFFQRLRALAVGSFALLGLTSPANAASVVVQADSITWTGTPGKASVPDRAFDQTGLSANYLSGVTDFDSFVTTTTHFSGRNTANAFWLGNKVTIDFFFSELVTIDAFAYWRAADPGTATEILLQVGKVPETFNFPNKGISPTAEDAFVATFSQALTTRRLRLTLMGIGDVGIGEIAFRGLVDDPTPAPVPVPAAAPLMLGAVGFLALRKRLNRARR